MSNNLTNDIKRVRKKLKVLDMEGSYLLLADIIDETVMDYTESSTVLSPKWIEKIIKNTRSKLENELEELLAKQQHFSQGKLEI